MDEILNLIESVSEVFSSYSFMKKNNEMIMSLSKLRFFAQGQGHTEK